MKKISIIAGLMVAATVALPGCKQDVPESLLQPVTLTADTGATKTSNDGLHTLWAADDQLSVFNTLPSGGYGEAAVFTLSQGAGERVAQFTGTVPTLDGTSSYDWYALYSDTDLEKFPIKTPASREKEQGSIYLGYGRGLQQDTYDSMSALKGSTCPMYAVAKSVSGSELPSFSMKHLTSVIEFNVVNNTAGKLVVNSVKLNATEDVVGLFCVDFTGDQPVFTAVEGQVKNNPVVTIVKPAEIAVGGTAKIYLPIKPYVHDTSKDFEVELDVEIDGVASTSVFKLHPNAQQGTFVAGLIKPVTLSVVPPAPVDGLKATIDFSKQGYSNAEQVASLVQDPFTVNFSNGGNPCAYYDTGTAVRVYKGGSLELRCKSKYLIKKVEIIGEANKGAVLTGTGLDGTVWSGSATSVTFEVTSAGHYRFQKLSIVYEENPEAVSQTWAVNIADGIFGGSVSASKTGGIAEGESVTLTVSPDSGYILESLVVDGDDVTSGVAEGKYTFNMPAHDVSVSASFNAIPTGHGEVEITAAALTDGKLSSDGFTLTFDKKNGSTTPTFNDKGGDLRLYAKGTLTIDGGGRTISKIVFNLSAQGLNRLAPITSSVGDVAAQSKGDATVSWSGSASEITFTVGDHADYGSDGSSKAGQLCFSSVVITY